MAHLFDALGLSDVDDGGQALSAGLFDLLDGRVDGAGQLRRSASASPVSRGEGQTTTHLWMRRRPSVRGPESQPDRCVEKGDAHVLAAMVTLAPS